MIPTSRLSKVAEFIRDGTHGSPVRTETGIPVLSAMNVKNGVLNFSTDRFTSLEEFEAFSRRLPLAKGDVLLTIVGTIGRAAVMDTVAPLIFQRSVAVIRPKESVYLGRYLYHVTQSQDFQTQLDRAANKSSQAGVYLGKLGDTEVPLPPLPEQRRIAAILDQADALRAKRREALAQLDSLTQSIFIEMFGDPVKNPKSWPVVNLGALIHSASDGPHVSPTYADSGVPFLSTRHVRPGEISWSDLKYLTQGEAEIQWRKCKPGLDDILYTKGGTTGFAAVVRTDEEFAVWVHVALLKPNKKLVNSTWLEAMLNSQYCYRQSQELTHGIANRDLGLKRMVNILMYHPPLELQHQFKQHMEVLADQKKRQQLSLAELDTLFTALQHRAFRGEL